MGRATDLDSLMQLVRWYYPSGVEVYDPRYQETEQAKRLRALMDGMAPAMGLVEKYTVGLAPVPHEVMTLGATVQELSTWPAFLQRLKDQFSNCTVSNKTLPSYDPCYACQVYLTEIHPGRSLRYDAVVCLLSLLAPVYAIYGCCDVMNGESWTRFPPLPEEFQDHERRLAVLIEAEFGFTRLASDVLLTPTPDLVPPFGNLLLGEARLIDCLISTEHPAE